MPKTTGQKILFGLLMSFFMVLAMELYNTGLRNGGLTNAGILEALRELPLMFVLCFLTSTVAGEPLAARLAARLAVPREWPLAAVLARDQTPDGLGRMAAFFTVVGDTLAMLALQPEEHEDICRPPLSPAEKPGSPPCGP